MKVSIEIQPALSEPEVIIKCAAIDSKVDLLVKQLAEKQPIIFNKGNTEYFFDVSEVLFFETDGTKVYAHTASDSYWVKEKLYELEQTLPFWFTRVSKSTILNAKRIHAITRNITASSVIEFAGTYKKVYVSRKYYALLRQKIDNKE